MDEVEFDDIKSAFSGAMKDEGVWRELSSSMKWIIIGWAIRAGMNRWRGTKGVVAAYEVTVITIDQLQSRRSLLSSYALWAVGGLLGIHHFYLHRFIHGLLALWSLNFFGMGFFLDGMCMPAYVRRFNACCHDSAPLDRSRRTLCCRLPTMLLLIWGLSAGFIVHTPRILHFAGVLDIDRLSAQTEANPYDTLGIAYSASMADIKMGYRKASLKWHPDRNPGCGKECDNKMADIAKAFELVKRRKAPPPEDRTWDAWLRNLGSDWMMVADAIG